MRSRLLMRAVLECMFVGSLALLPWGTGTAHGGELPEGVGTRLLATDAHADPRNSVEGVRSENAALGLTLGATAVPTLVGISLATESGNEALAGWLVAGGLLAGPSVGLAYGQCYRHALVGMGIRTLASGIAFAGLALSIDGYGDAQHNASKMVGVGVALYFADLIYDAATVRGCTRRNNARHAKQAISLGPWLGPAGRGVGLSVQARFGGAGAE